MKKKSILIIAAIFLTSGLVFSQTSTAPKEGGSNNVNSPQVKKEGGSNNFYTGTSQLVRLYCGTRQNILELAKLNASRILLGPKPDREGAAKVLRQGLIDALQVKNDKRFEDFDPKGTLTYRVIGWGLGLGEKIREVLALELKDKDENREDLQLHDKQATLIDYYLAYYEFIDSSLVSFDYDYYSPIRYSYGDRILNDQFIHDYERRYSFIGLRFLDWLLRDGSNGRSGQFLVRKRGVTPLVGTGSVGAIDDVIFPKNDYTLKLFFTAAAFVSDAVAKDMGDKTSPYSFEGFSCALADLEAARDYILTIQQEANGDDDQPTLELNQIVNLLNKARANLRPGSCGMK